ncbi:MAG TPA: hypothetical protein VG755_07325 [Nannocystaceae bacterium]|nr:hypothetical protein [Nannocystaceae bacterium]
MLHSALGACGFDSGGIATGSNSNGMLDSAGDTSGDASTTQSTTTSMTSTTASTTMPSTTVSEETGPATTMPGTTENPTEPTTSDPTLDPTDTASSSGANTNATSSEGGSSSEGGPPGEPYYEDCSGEGDCGSGECYVYVDGMSNPLAHVCYIPCMGMPCPPPPNGTADPICNGLDRCVLDCGGGATCPTGMDCYTLDFGMGQVGYRCSWAD